MIELLPHNEAPYAALCEEMKRSKRCAYVSATGTGKSYVAAKYAEGKRTAIFVPAISIARAWSKLLPAAKIITYQAAAKKTADLSGFELLICDEMHHLGAKQWGAAYTAAIKDWRGEVIGLSATPIRYLDNGRDMTEECFAGRSVTGYTLPEAIKQGVLPGFEYITALYTVPDTKKYKSAQTDRLIAKLNLMKSELAFQNILKKNLPQNPKTIIFCPGIADIETIKAACAEVCPNLVHAILCSAQTEPVQKESLASFTAAESGFLYVVDMLNEGVHTENVNSIIMFRKTESPTIYLQQIGRALSCAGANEKPKIFDFVANHSTVKSYNTISGDGIAALQKSAGKEQIIIKDYALEELQLFEKIRDIFSGKWTEEEDEILRTNRNKTARELMILLPGRTKESIQARRRALFGPVDARWTEAEDNILLQNQTLTAAELEALLPGRTSRGIRTRCAYLGIKKQNAKWSAEEIACLKKNATKKDREIAELLPGRSASAISTKRKELFPDMRRNGCEWTKAELDVLLKNSEMPSKELEKLLPGRSASSIRSKRIQFVDHETKRPWTEEEQTVLLQNRALSVNELSVLIPSRSKAAIAKKQRKLNGTADKTWKNWEDSIIINSNGLQMAEFSKLLPGRTARAISHRAQKLGVHISQPRKWTEDEIRTITEYPEKNIEELCELLPGRSGNAVRQKRARMKKEATKHNRLASI